MGDGLAYGHGGVICHDVHVFLNLLKTSVCIFAGAFSTLNPQ